MASPSAHPVDAEGRVIPDASWPPGREAPARLERVRRFANTTNRESGADHLGEPVRAARWLGDEGWHVRPTAAELVALRRFRDELHELLSGKGDWPAAAAAVRLGVDLGTDGPTLVGTGAGTARVVSDVVAILVEAHLDGTLARLRVCANDHCGWAFYDRSRNGTGHWCSMGACGQRQKMRRYRARHRPDPVR